jgi:hypothetical protein
MIRGSFLALADMATRGWMLRLVLVSLEIRKKKIVYFFSQSCTGIEMS